MKWNEARAKILEGCKVKRPKWSVWLHRCEEGGICIYRNPIAQHVVGYSPYEPDEKDLKARDWEIKKEDSENH